MGSEMCIRDRVIPHGYDMQLSNSWAAPERGERLAELAGAGKHDSRSLIAMQYDQTTTFAAKLKKMFEAPGMAQPLKQAIDALPAADRAKAHEAYSRLMAFDGKLSPTSTDAAIYELFLQESTRQIFLDELGPQSSPAWKAFVADGKLSYAAQFIKEDLPDAFLQEQLVDCRIGGGRAELAVERHQALSLIHI